MAGDAFETIKRFWEIQDGAAALIPLLADDAVVVDMHQGPGVDRVRNGQLTDCKGDINS
jgi:hypothetical protein